MDEYEPMSDKDIFVFDPNLADDVTELGCLDDLKIDWNDDPLDDNISIGNILCDDTMQDLSPVTVTLTPPPVIVAPAVVEDVDANREKRKGSQREEDNYSAGFNESGMTSPGEPSRPLPPRSVAPVEPRFHTNETHMIFPNISMPNIPISGASFSSSAPGRGCAKSTKNLSSTRSDIAIPTNSSYLGITTVPTAGTTCRTRHTEAFRQNISGSFEKKTKQTFKFTPPPPPPRAQRCRSISPPQEILSHNTSTPSYQESFRMNSSPKLVANANQNGKPYSSQKQISFSSGYVFSRNPKLTPRTNHTSAHRIVADAKADVDEAAVSRARQRRAKRKEIIARKMGRVSSVRPINAYSFDFKNFQKRPDEQPSGDRQALSEIAQKLLQSTAIDPGILSLAAANTSRQTGFAANVSAAVEAAASITSKHVLLPDVVVSSPNSSEVGRSSPPHNNLPWVPSSMSPSHISPNKQLPIVSSWNMQSAPTPRMDRKLTKNESVKKTRKMKSLAGKNYTQNKHHSHSSNEATTSAVRAKSPAPYPPTGTFTATPCKQGNGREIKVEGKHPKSISSLPNDYDVEDHLASLPEGTDPESRRQRRLIRNRLSAALHRKRKRETLDHQQKTIEEKETIIELLREQLKEVTSKCTSLESDLEKVKHYYGVSDICRVLQNSRQTSSQYVPNSPPHMVNLSGGSSSSDQSTCSEDGDTCVSTPPCSPPHDSHDINRKASSSMKIKRKRTVGMLPVLATVAMCGLLGCVIVPDNVLNSPGAMGPYSHSSSSVVVAPQDERRRLQQWSELDWDEELDPKKGGRTRHEQEPWVISPIEMYPGLWTLDSVSHTPWTAQRSFQLFDLNDSVPTASSILRTHSFTDSSIYSEQGSTRTATTVIDSDERTSPAGRLRGSGAGNQTMEENLLKIPVNQTSILHGTNKSNKMEDATTANYIDLDLDLDGDEEFEYESLDDEELDEAEVHATASTRDLASSSFMFCPSAHASLSPSFLERIAMSAGNRQPSRFSSVHNDDNISDREQLAKSYGQRELTSEDVFDTGENVAYAGSDESKALVPTHFDYYKEQLFRSSASQSESSVVKSIGGGDDPYMVILLPASAISGGIGVGADGKKGSSNPNSDEDKPWVELECHVKSARVVDGVSFVGDPTVRLHDEDEE